MRSPLEDLLIIGYGNSLRGDDGAGPQAARELRGRGFPALEVHQLAPELAEAISRVKLVVFTDASVELEPGQVRVTPVREDRASAFEHHISPGGLLRLTREVYERAPAALVIAIGGESYELGDALSDSALRAIQDVVDICAHAGTRSCANASAVLLSVNSRFRTPRGSRSPRPRQPEHHSASPD